MALLPLLLVLVQSLIQYPQPAGDGLDEATHQRMKERQELLDHEMARLLQELEQQDKGWGAVLFGALQQWPCWVLAGVLLLLGLWLSCRRRSCEASSYDVNEGEGRVDGQKEYTDVKVQESSDASEERCREKEDCDDGKEESGSGGMEDREKTGDAGNEQGILLVDHIERPVEDLDRDCSVTAEQMQSLTPVFVDSVSNRFYPVPQEAIGVGRASEGWSPRDWDGVYRMLVQLNPLPRYTFNLELNSARQGAARTFSIRVKLVRT